MPLHFQLPVSFFSSLVIVKLTIVEHPPASLCMYSQTWAKDHLWIATTCLQRQPFQRPNFNYIIYIIYHYLWTRTTCQQRLPFFGPKGGRCTQVWLYYLRVKVDEFKVFRMLIFKSTFPFFYGQLSKLWSSSHLCCSHFQLWNKSSFDL
jgi:hypothetical protein